MLDGKERVFALARMTEPGSLDYEGHTLAEWQGVIRTTAKAEFDQKDPLELRGMTAWPTPYLVGITWTINLDNSEYTGPRHRPDLYDPVGLELWAPIQEDHQSAFLDPLKPRSDWDTSMGTWARLRLHRCLTRRFTLVGSEEELEVHVRSTGNESWKLEVVQR